MTIPSNSYTELTIVNQKTLQMADNSKLNQLNVLNQKRCYSSFFLADIDRKVCRNVDALIDCRIIQLKTLSENKYFKSIQSDSQHVEIDISIGLKSLKTLSKKPEHELELLTDLISPLMQIIRSNLNYFDLKCPNLHKKFISPLIDCLEKEVLTNLWERSKLLILMNQDAPQDVHGEIIKKMIELSNLSNP